MQACKRTFTAARRGFTLVELVLVILLVGILAVYALPRLASRSDFTPYSYRDQLINLLRLAQLQAMESGPCHQLLFSGLQFGIPRRSYASISCDATLRGSGEQYAAPHLGLTQAEAATLAFSLGNAPSRIDFDAWGRPLVNGVALSATYRITFTGQSVLALCLEPEGYVHVCA